MSKREKFKAVWWTPRNTNAVRGRNKQHTKIFGSVRTLVTFLRASREPKIAVYQVVEGRWVRVRDHAELVPVPRRMAAAA